MSKIFVKFFGVIGLIKRIRVIIKPEKSYDDYFDMFAANSKPVVKSKRRIYFDHKLLEWVTLNK